MHKNATSGAPAKNAAVPTGGRQKKGPLWALKMPQNAQNRNFWRPCEERRSPYGGVGKKGPWGALGGPWGAPGARGPGGLWCPFLGLQAAQKAKAILCVWAQANP